MKNWLSSLETVSATISNIATVLAKKWIKQFCNNPLFLVVKPTILFFTNLTYSLSKFGKRLRKTWGNMNNNNNDSQSNVHLTLNLRNTETANVKKIFYFEILSKQIFFSNHSLLFTMNNLIGGN